MPATLRLLSREVSSLPRTLIELTRGLQLSALVFLGWRKSPLAMTWLGGLHWHALICRSSLLVRPFQVFALWCSRLARNQTISPHRHVLKVQLPAALRQGFGLKQHFSDQEQVVLS